MLHVPFLLSLQLPDLSNENPANEHSRGGGADGARVVPHTGHEIFNTTRATQRGSSIVALSRSRLSLPASAFVQILPFIFVFISRIISGLR